jgi:ribonuclease BN (tRNA processing enzyme)
VGLSLTVLGCSGSYPGPGAACSGYLVQGGGVSVWLDAGSGTLANLQRHIGLHEIDAVVLSHEHVDHWSDVEGLFVALAYVNPAPQPRSIPVYAPAGVRIAAQRFSSTETPLTWHDVTDGDRLDIGGLGFRFSRTDHPTETLAVRVDGEGRSLAYSADTGTAWSLAELGPGIDLALCEATHPLSKEGTYQHMSAREAGEMAKAAGAKRLLLTHLWPTVDPKQSQSDGELAFGGPTAVAEIHRRYEV